MVLGRYTDRVFISSRLLLLDVKGVFDEGLRVSMMSREMERRLLRGGSYKWTSAQIVWMKYPDDKFIS